MDQDERIAELERRLTEMERQGGGVRMARSRWPRRRLTRRLGPVLSLAVVMIAGPAVVLASHYFSDVPTSNSFHSQIGSMKDAGITSGCSATLYCPNDPVTRGQMAAFLRRGLPRISESTFNTTLTNTSLDVVGSIDVKAGDVPGGTAQVKIDAAVNAFASPTACSCRVVWYIERDFGQVGNVNWAIDLTAPGAGFAWSSTALTAVDTIPTGVVVTYYITAVRTGSVNVGVFGNITAVTAPFNETGGTGVASSDMEPVGADPAMPSVP